MPSNLVIVESPAKANTSQCYSGAMKLMIWLGIFVGGAVGGAIGGVLDGGLGVWSIVLSTICSLAGIWAGYRHGKSHL